MHAFLDSRPGWAIFSTLGRDGTPHTVPLGYYRLGDEIVMGVRDETTKVSNLDRDARASLLLEAGETMTELRGVLFQGRAFVHRAPDEVLHYAREGARTRGVPEADWPTQANPGSVYLRFVPERTISWDYSPTPASKSA